jgi:hypothetical protein
MPVTKEYIQTMPKPSLKLIPPTPSVTLTLEPCTCGCKALMVSEHSHDRVSSRGSVLIEEHARAGRSASVSRVVYYRCLHGRGKETDSALVPTEDAETVALELAFKTLKTQGYTLA